MLRAFPNPGTAAVQLPLELAGAAEGGKASYRVTAEVFDLSGRRVRVLHDGVTAPGLHQFRWDGRTAAGIDAGAGIFFARITVDGKSAGTQKLTRLP